MSNPDEDAREEAYEALDALDRAPPRERLGLSIRAVRIDPTLTEAYVAAAAAFRQDTPEALAVWLAAREIARRDAGAILIHDAGRVGDSAQARPYLYACHGYALCALENGDVDEAVAQLTRLLALDATDRVAARYSLGPALLLDRRFGAFGAFRETQADEESAFWLYADAYHAVASKAGASVRKSRLKAALTANAHVPGFLLLDEPHRQEPADYAQRGSPEEAHALVCSIVGRLWRSDTAALTALMRAAG